MSWARTQLFSRVMRLSLSAAFDRRANEFAEALNPLRVGQGLTPNQDAYARARFEGHDPHDAYVIAFNPEGWQRDSITRRGYDLDHDSRILARVAQLNAERMKDSSLLPFLSREFVVDGVMRIAMTGEKENVRLQAYALLGKTVGIDLFRETTRVERVDRSPDDVDRELKQKLQDMMKGLTIDGAAPVDVTPATKPQPAGKVDRRRKPVAR